MRSSRRKKKFLAFAVVIIAITAYFFAFTSDLIAATCEEEVRAEVINIINDGNEVIRKLGIFYEDYFTVIKDNNDKVTMVKANSALINQINMIIRTEIQNRLNELRTKSLYIPVGAFTGLTFLSNYGSKVPINAKIISNCNTAFSSEFKEMGINQTLHRLQINCCIEIEFTVPKGKVKSNVTNEILVTEAVIVGEVPSTFLGENTTTDYLDLLPD